MSASVDERVTVSWLTEILSHDTPGLVVEEALFKGHISGASSKLRMRMRTNRDDYPAAMVVKAGLEAHSPAVRSMHDNEMHACLGQAAAPLTRRHVLRCVLTSE